MSKQNLKTTFFKKTALFGLFFLAFFIFSFLIGTKDARAETTADAKGTCMSLMGAVKTGLTHLECNTYCRDTWGTTGCFWNEDLGTNQKKMAPMKQVYYENNSYCNLATGNLAMCLLTPVMWLAKLILLIAATIFSWIIDVKNIHYIINNNSVLYDVWTTVRDILNIVFILILLFSAFCTIFQVSKYNYKKILLTLVIMALLVNFSYPIARVIIDASNVMMYSIISSQISSTTGFFVDVSNNGQLATILNPPGGYASAGMMLTGIVFIFILGITLVAVAVLLVIRMVALAVLIIFSPIGFVGNIMPGFEKYASQWWDNLFKYAFFGPIMMLGLYIATSVMKAMISITSIPIMQKMAQKTSTQIDPNLIGSMAFFSIPIVILWMTMGLAQSMSIAGASTVMGAAQKVIKGAGKWSAKNLTGYNAAKWGIKKSGVPGGVKQRWNRFKETGFFGSQKTAQREAAIAGKLGDKTAAERNMKTRASEYEKNNESEADLKKWATGGDSAAAYALANKGKIDPTTFSMAMNAIKDEKTKESLAKKTGESRMDVTLDYKWKEHAKKVAAGDPEAIAKGWANIKDLATAAYGDLTAEEWAKQKKLTDQFTKPIDSSGTIIGMEAKAAFKTLARSAQLEAFKRMNGANASAVT